MQDYKKTKRIIEMLIKKRKINEQYRVVDIHQLHNYVKTNLYGYYDKKYCRFGKYPNTTFGKLPEKIRCTFQSTGKQYIFYPRDFEEVARVFYETLTKLKSSVTDALDYLDSIDDKKCAICYRTQNVLLRYRTSVITKNLSSIIDNQSIQDMLHLSDAIDLDMLQAGRDIMEVPDIKNLLGLEYVYWIEYMESMNQRFISKLFKHLKVKFPYNHILYTMYPYVVAYSTENGIFGKLEIYEATESITGSVQPHLIFDTELELSDDKSIVAVTNMSNHQDIKFESDDAKNNLMDTSCINLITKHERKILDHISDSTRKKIYTMHEKEMIQYQDFIISGFDAFSGVLRGKMNQSMMPDEARLMLEELDPERSVLEILYSMYVNAIITSVLISTRITSYFNQYDHMINRTGDYDIPELDIGEDDPIDTDTVII